MVMRTAIVFLCCAIALSTFGEEREIAVTVYNQNRAVVRDVRTFELAKGVNEVSFTDVAALIDPTSVHFKSLTDPRGCAVKEQNFDYDVADDAKMLWKYVGTRVRILTKSGNLYEGKLIKAARARGNSFSPTNVIIEGGSRLGKISIIRLEAIRSFEFVEMPRGFVTKPTLRWRLKARKGGKHRCEIAYMTAGMDWRADYKVILSDDRDTLDMLGVVTIDNHSGATYPNAKLKLVAGKVQMVEERVARDKAVAFALAERKAAAPQFKERKFFEYHLYDLQRRATLRDNEIKQIDFMSAEDVSFERIYVYDGALFVGYGGVSDERYGTACDKRVQVYIKFKNSEENHMGMPLPMGKIRMFARRGETEEFIGEAGIDHTPKDEEILLRVGVANDIVGERVQTEFRRPTRRTIEESFRITLRNHKRKKVEVRVVEHMYRCAQWEIIAESERHIKTDSRTIEFRVEVPPEGEHVVTYTVRYTF